MSKFFNELPNGNYVYNWTDETCSINRPKNTTLEEQEGHLILRWEQEENVEAAAYLAVISKQKFSPTLPKGRCFTGDSYLVPGKQFAKAIKTTIVNHMGDCPLCNNGLFFGYVYSLAPNGAMSRRSEIAEVIVANPPEFYKKMVDFFGQHLEKKNIPYVSRPCDNGKEVEFVIPLNEEVQFVVRPSIERGTCYDMIKGKTKINFQKMKVHFRFVQNGKELDRYHNITPCDIHSSIAKENGFGSIVGTGRQLEAVEAVFSLSRNFK